jgi:hypothetical protein
MTEARLAWSIWQAVLQAVACSFTRRGSHRFAEWKTVMGLNVEEPRNNLSRLTPPNLGG